MMPDTSNPTHALVPSELFLALLEYLNSKPRSETNTLASALEQCQGAIVKTVEEETKEEVDVPS
jgi:hypothetical protein